MKLYFYNPKWNFAYESQRAVCCVGFLYISYGWVRYVISGGTFVNSLCFALFVVLMMIFTWFIDSCKPRSFYLMKNQSGHVILSRRGSFTTIDKIPSDIGRVNLSRYFYYRCKLNESRWRYVYFYDYASACEYVKCLRRNLN